MLVCHFLRAKMNIFSYFWAKIFFGEHLNLISEEKQNGWVIFFPNVVQNINFERLIKQSIIRILFYICVDAYYLGFFETFRKMLQFWRNN